MHTVDTKISLGSWSVCKLTRIFTFQFLDLQGFIDGYILYLYAIREGSDQIKWMCRPILVLSVLSYHKVLFIVIPVV